eukprot:SAG22_NODE_8415_length_658_cov_1.175313_1_plen_77_part_10
MPSARKASRSRSPAAPASAGSDDVPIEEITVLAVLTGVAVGVGKCMAAGHEPKNLLNGLNNVLDAHPDSAAAPKLPA